MTPAAVADRYAAIRARTAALAEPLSPEDCCVQSMTEASPAKWHLAHTTWFFETFVLERFEEGFRPFAPAYRVLFNSYYNSIGDKHPRPERGLLTRPPLAEVLAYRRAIDARMAAVLARRDLSAEAVVLAELGIHHEQQHQELILTDIKHLLSLNPLQPAYGKTPESGSAAPEMVWMGFEGGTVVIGHGGEGFCYDNETPRHRVLLEPYRLASRAVTNGEFQEFAAAGGYRDARLWLAEGWDWVASAGRSGPLYWRRGGGEFTLGGVVPRDPGAPVAHVSYYEADAFARWAGARLPTEAEWEHAAAGALPVGNFGQDGRFHPRAADAAGLAQIFGDVWEWTQSAYAPYPGFRAAPGAVGEYNGKFMVNQQVLRGGSCATPEGHVRASYRNFFPAAASWQFSGIRLARDGL
ncbi:MAG TPA: ergothioneine biosynthesis protein EgtB [Rhodocyclaceae bacterium]